MVDRKEPKKGAGLFLSLLSTKGPTRAKELKPAPNLVRIRFLYNIFLFI